MIRASRTVNVAGAVSYSRIKSYHTYHESETLRTRKEHSITLTPHEEYYDFTSLRSIIHSYRTYRDTVTRKFPRSDGHLISHLPLLVTFAECPKVSLVNLVTIRYRYIAVDIDIDIDIDTNSYPNAHVLVDQSRLLESCKTHGLATTSNGTPSISSSSKSSPGLSSPPKLSPDLLLHTEKMFDSSRRR